MMNADSVFSSPIGPRTLRRQVHPINAVVVVVHDFGQTKVSDFYFPTGCAVHQQDVTCVSKYSRIKAEAVVMCPDFTNAQADRLPGLRS